MFERFKDLILIEWFVIHFSWNLYIYRVAGLQITTRPLANMSNFICGHKKIKDLIAHMVSKRFVQLFGNPIEVRLNFYFHFSFHYLLPIKHILESKFLFDQCHTKSCTFRGYPCNFFFFVTAFNISLKLWAPKYQCGREKLDKFGAHMAPGVLK